jgi:hypothetical protein
MEETLSEDAVAVAPRVDEEQRVAGWRLHVLLEAGYPEPLAASLAASKADLHQAVRLVAQGCPADLAAAILL